MSEIKGKKAGNAAVTLGRISIILSFIGLAGGIIIAIAFLIPKSDVPHKISNVEVLRLIMFLIGAIPTYIVAPAGGIMGIISLVKMKGNGDRDMRRLPIAAVIMAVVAVVIAVVSIQINVRFY